MYVFWELIFQLKRHDFIDKLKCLPTENTKVVDNNKRYPCTASCKTNHHLPHSFEIAYKLPKKMRSINRC